MQGDGASSHTQGQQLPPVLQLHILSFLPPNDRALSGRLVSPDAAAGLSEPQHCTAFLSQPLPPHAVPWALEAGQQQVRQLPFRHKLQLLCTAAASGSEVNLGAAWAALQPSFFHEGLCQCQLQHRCQDPGVAAMEAGQPQLLPWLLRRCRGMLDAKSAMVAATKHCELAAMQLAWAALKCSLLDGTEQRDGGRRSTPVGKGQWVLDGAAQSTSSDAVAKMEWLLQQTDLLSCKLKKSTAVAAARSGDLARLRWLRERGCRMGGCEVLKSALEHADLAVARWLVDEAGCKLPPAGADYAAWADLAFTAATSPDGLEKLLWLQQKGAPVDAGLWESLARFGLSAGHVGLARHVLAVLGPNALDLVDVGRIVTSKSIAAVELLHNAGLLKSETAYERAARCGDVAMLSWLVRSAKLPTAELELWSVIRSWPDYTPAYSRGLLQAVQLLMGEAGCAGWDDAGEVVILAAERGELALVQYLLQQRPEYRPDWEVLAAAALGGCEALLEWLVEQHPGCLKGSGSGVSPYASAAARGDLGTLTALRRLGVPWGAEDVMGQAVTEECSAYALRWLAEQGAPVGSREAMEEALDGNDGLHGAASAEVAAWLRSLAAAEAVMKAAAR